MFVVQFIKDSKGWPMINQKVGVLGNYVSVVRNLAAPGFIKCPMPVSWGIRRFPGIHIFNTDAAIH